MRLALTVQALRACGPLAPSRVEDIESAAAGSAGHGGPFGALGLTLRAQATEQAPVLQ